VNPRYPIYVISKGRWNSRYTVKALIARNIPHRVVIEPQERDQYAVVIDPATLLVLPFSNLGQGSIPARNWVWKHSVTEGHARHWILDDNIKGFMRYNQNQRIKTSDGATFVAVEDFTERYSNVALSGMDYCMFAVTGSSYTGGKGYKTPPVKINTRIYSCILVNNSIPYRWRGRYNEDTDLSLRALKDGWCTLLFCAFLCDKAATMSIKGGNTESLYKLDGKTDGRLLMAQSLIRQHPDVVKITRKWGRWQHHVDYRPFKANKLRLRAGIMIPNAPNEYGMTLRKKGKPCPAK